MRDRIEDDYDNEDHQGSDNGFTQVPNVILRDTNLSKSARLLYCLLLMHTWDKDFCFPSQETLGEYLGASPRHISTLISELKAKEYIEVKRRGYESTNTYILRFIPKSEQYKTSYKEMFS